MDWKVDWGVAHRRQRSKVQHKTRSTRGDRFSPMALNQLLEEYAAAVLLLIAEPVSRLLLKYRLTI